MNSPNKNKISINGRSASGKMDALLHPPRVYIFNARLSTFQYKTKLSTSNSLSVYARKGYFFYHANTSVQQNIPAQK